MRLAIRSTWFPFSAGCALALCALLAAPAALAAPSTLGPVIGSALLCRSHLDNSYFYSWLSNAYGPSYKHEGGAYWFKADGNLWGEQVAEIMVSDDSSELVFIGAVTETTPDQLTESIRKSVGVRHEAQGASAFPLRASRQGSSIVYFANKSKIFCARYKPIPVGTSGR